MIIELINLGGYGYFVWPAFIFTFISCLILFIKTKKEFIRLEKIYLKESTGVQLTQIKEIRGKKVTSQVLTSHSI
tara:strand:- start:473 stop:697 length:225 start_codon:yes stop_codon:yes gene_type:complete